MKFEQRQSGLVTPIQKTEPPKRLHGVLEIQDEDARECARQALLELWDAMALTSGRGLGGNDIVGDAYYRLYRYVGEMLLGKDCPEKEVLC